MKEIYTCPECGHRYTVSMPGNYICDCGHRFDYPSWGESFKANYAASPAISPFSANTSHLNRSIHVPEHCKISWLKHRTRRLCPMSQLSLFLGFLSLATVGLFSLPAIWAALKAEKQILNPSNNYCGRAMALSALWMGVSGVIAGCSLLIIASYLYQF